MMYIVPTPNSLIANRFWEKVAIGEPDDCWEWLGAKDGRSGYNYGRAWNGETTIYAHRLSWMLVNGKIPEFIDGRKTMIRHLCGNHSCVNPRHLAIGNGSDNCNDYYATGRGLKFTSDEVRIIKKLKLFDLSNGDIGRGFNAPAGTISNVLRGKGIYSEY